MFKGLTNHKDTDMDDAAAHRRDFIARMEQKLAYKESLLDGRA